MKNTKIGETCLAASRIESEFLSKLIETVKSQSEMIARLNRRTGRTTEKKDASRPTAARSFPPTDRQIALIQPVLCSRLRAATFVANCNK